MIGTDPMRRPRNSGPPLLLLPIALAGALSACVQVTAPERPIEINLNINIRQEVVVRLQDDARQLIQNNPGVF